MILVCIASGSSLFSDNASLMECLPINFRLFTNYRCDVNVRLTSQKNYVVI